MPSQADVLNEQNRAKRPKTAHGSTQEHAQIEAGDVVVNVAHWRLISPRREPPQQTNADDCGVRLGVYKRRPFFGSPPLPLLFLLIIPHHFQVFTSIYANYLSLDLDLNFSADHMRHFREKITCALLKAIVN